MTRRLPRTLLPLLATLGLAACGPPGGAPPQEASARGGLPPLDPGQRVEITWETYNLASADAGADAVRELVRRFERRHPNISVKLQAPQGGETQDNVRSVQRQAATGDPPDVVQLVFDGLRYYADGLGAQPIDDVVGEAAVDAHLARGRHPYHPRAATLADVDGRTVGLPYVFSTPVLYYNADLLERAGVDPDTPPTTWAGVASAARAIAARTDAGGAGVLCLYEGVGDWCLKGILRSGGGRAASPDGRRIGWADPASVHAIAALQGLRAGDEDVLPNVPWEDALEEFQRGRLGFFLSTSAVQGSLIEAADGEYDLRAAPMPSFGARPAVPTNSGAGLYLFAREPQQQAASWELMKFLTGPEAQTVIAEDVGYLPLRDSLVDDPAYLKSFADTQRGLIRPNLAQLDRLEPADAFAGPSFEQITGLMMDAVDEVVFRGGDPQRTLREAAERADRLLPDA